MRKLLPLSLLAAGAGAAASIGQVHKAVLPDGRVVAVKVQYPGIDKAIKGDLDNAEMLYGLFASFALKNMDVKALVDELRARMADELDYRLEANLQQEFADRYRGHPFLHDPERIYYYVSRPDVPFQSEEFTYTRTFVAEMIETLLDIQGEYSDVIRVSNMPPSYVILDRVVWGMSALLGRLEARNHWRALLDEYRNVQTTSTALRPE